MSLREHFLFLLKNCDRKSRSSEKALFCLVFLIHILIVSLLIALPSAYSAQIGFDYPVGPPDASGWYITQIFGEYYSAQGEYHLGEDWKKTSGSTEDESVHAIAKGIVVHSEVGGGCWLNVIIIRHTLADGSQVESLYGHLKSRNYDVGEVVEKGAEIGKIGNPYCGGPHLHFELRSSDCPYWDSHTRGTGYSSTQRPEGWLDPSDFITRHRLRITLHDEPFPWELFYPAFIKKGLIPNNPPKASIIQPSDGSTFTEGDEIAFRGTGNDPEDGILMGNHLTWTSDKDGQIGTGQSLTTNTLSVNTHTITLTAIDYDGAIGTDSITISVTAASVECSDPYEPNSSFTEATYLISTDEYRRYTIYDSYICSGSDVDYFKIIVNSDVRFLGVGVSQFHYGNDHKDYDLYLYDSSFNQIEKSATRPPCIGCINLETVTYMPDFPNYIPKGTYYIKVVGYNGAHDNERAYMLDIIPSPY